MENKGFKKTIAAIPRLPVELLDEICSWAQQPPNAVNLSALSLVSREFCSLAQPRLLSHLNIGGFSTQLRRRPAQLKSLSEGKCAASRFAKSLTFDFTLSFAREDPAKVLSPIEIVMHKHLKAAIQSCKKVERIVSIVGDLDPQWIHDQIFESSQILPLKELVVRVINCGNPSLRIGSLFNLRKLCIDHSSSGSSLPQSFIDQLAILISQCPNLTHLEVSCRHTSIEGLFRVINADNTNPPLSIEHLSFKNVEVTALGLELALRHLKTLKYFGLLENRTGFGGLYDNISIWAILRREKIVLSTIFTDWLELEGLGLYLQAFPGLENLHVRPLIPHGHISSLLQFVFPQHSISLVELNIDSTLSFVDYWKWPFDEASIRALSSFPNLQIFGVTFGHQLSYGQDSIAPESIKTLLEFSLENFPKLQRVVIHMVVPGISERPHFQYNLPLQWPQWLSCDVHEAILAHPVEYHGIESMPVIECQGVVYYASRNLATGDRSYMPLHPITFEGLNQLGARANCRRWKYQT